MQVELSEVNAKQLAIKAERDATEEQLKHKDVVYKEAMKVCMCIIIISMYQL